MNCPNCHSPVDERAQFCSQCGHEIKTSPRRRLPRTTVYFGMLVGLALMLSILALWQSQGYRERPSDAIDFAAKRQTGDSPSTPGDGKIFASDRQKVQAGRMSIPVGTLVIEDIASGLISESMAPVMDNGWVPLPLELAKGGFRWRLEIRDVGETSIVGGVFRDFDTVGLWQMATPPLVNGPDLSPWRDDEPVDWVSLESGNRLGDVMPRDCREEGYFISCGLPYGLSGPGVFVQENEVVGWTFGVGAERGFFWQGRDGERLRVEVYIEDYYRVTFADSREEKFLIALADDRQGNLQRLENLISAFRFPKRLTVEDTPEQLRDKTIHRLLMDSIQRAVAQGDAAAAINTFDRGTLLEIDDIDILLLVSRETGNLYGAASALELIEDVRAYISRDNREDSNRLNTFHRSLTIQHLEELARQGDWARVAKRLEIAQSYFPDDVELHLFAVRLALSDKDWAEAERLLYSRSYPSSLQVQVADIGKEIQELKGQEGRIVIRFTPGASNIPVRATLNGQVVQDFLIDTGASTVTIPSDAVRSLGIPTDSASPKRQVYTAGGLVTAREVILDSIEIDGWSVQHVKALVLDIPRRPGLGLLGLNYLDRFNVDMRPEEGILTLTPR